MGISGDFRTHNKELNIVKYALDKSHINYYKIEKDKNANDSDVIVWLTPSISFSIEVKEEDLKRINKYNDLGIDYISCCILKNSHTRYRWKGSPKSPKYLAEFENELDVNNKYFKWGKLL